MAIEKLLNVNNLNDTSDIWAALRAELINNKNTYGTLPYENQLSFAQSFTYETVRFLWDKVNYKKAFKCRTIKFEKFALNIESIKVSKNIANFLCELSLVECGYYIGVIYTILLPDEYKSEYGVYYTPPVLAERLLDLLAASGINWSKAKVLDPACGGGAFLIPVANRILGDHRIKKLNALERIKYLENHLAGIEIDCFAAWITKVLIDIITYADAAVIGRKMKNVIKVTDTIKYVLKEKKRYDLIIGNPPYGRISLSDEIREQYSRSLFGHANMYGLFIDAALRLKTKNGLIGYVTPTSFLGGEYFKNLRNLLTELAPPINLEFISDRAGVFEGVLQETCLVVYGKNVSNEVTINEIYMNNDYYSLERVGTFKSNLGQSPWILPRSHSEVSVINAIKTVKTTLKDYGYRVTTGPLVWNRHKDQIRKSYKKEAGIFPIIWSEAIKEDGNFSIKYRIRNGKKYIKINPGQEYLVCRNPVALIQRTTSKEQQRRIVTCVMDKAYFDKWNGAVIENHVNAIAPTIDNAEVSLEAIAYMLNTNIIDRIFRCISGSVAVSVSELHALPLPEPNKVKHIDQMITEYKTGKIDKDKLKSEIETIVTKAYGIEV